MVYFYFQILNFEEPLDIVCVKALRPYHAYKQILAKYPSAHSRILLLATPKVLDKFDYIFMKDLRLNRLRVKYKKLMKH